MVTNQPKDNEFDDIGGIPADDKVERVDPDEEEERKPYHKPSRRKSNYDEEDDYYEPRRRTSRRSVPLPENGGDDSKKRMVNILIMAVVAIIASFIVMKFFGGDNVSKADFTTNITNMVTDMNGIKTSLTESIADLSSNIDLALSQSETALSKVESNETNLAKLSTQVNEYNQSIATATNVANEAKTKADQYAQQITNLQNSNNTLSTKITELQASITELEDNSSNTSSDDTDTTKSNDDLTIKVVDVFTDIYAGDEEFDGTFKLMVTNNTTRSISKLSFMLYMYPSEDIDEELFVDSEEDMSMDGTISIKKRIKQTDTMFMFQTNATSISAGATGYLYFYPSIAFTEEAYMPYYVEVGTKYTNVDNQDAYTDSRVYIDEKYYTIDQNGNVNSSSDNDDKDAIRNNNDIEDTITFEIDCEIMDYILD